VVKLGCGKPGDEYVLVAGSSVKPGRTDWVKACTIRKQSRKEKK
jgi:hypothetical protein